MSDVDANRKIAVILVADVVGYSKHMANSLCNLNLGDHYV